MSKFNFVLGQYNWCLLENEGGKKERKLPKGRFTPDQQEHQYVNVNILLKC